jgi:hypothetical protein
MGFEAPTQSTPQRDATEFEKIHAELKLEIETANINLGYVVTIRDKLFGSEPRSISDERDEQKSQSGLIGELKMIINTLNSTQRKTGEILSRIQNAL